jgi:MFS family permease
MNRKPKPPFSIATYLAINRTVGIVLVTVLFFGLGEQLWEQFMPLYLKANAKPAARGETLSWDALWIVGLYACLRNLFEGFCYIGGGQLTARLGDRGSLILFALLTISGYLIFLFVPTWWGGTLAALLIMGWEPLSVPVTFTTVGSTLEKSRQGMAFAVQSIQKRLPKIIGPAIAGFVLFIATRYYDDDNEAHVRGMQILVSFALLLGITSLAIQIRWMPRRKVTFGGPSSLAIIRGLNPTLGRLLLAEILTRWCDWLVRVFVLLYVMQVCELSEWQAGVLFAIQNITALLTYLPIGKMTESVGLQPFIGLTFVFFALFPLTLAVVPPTMFGLTIAFIVYGLREIGEPARKALITSLMPEPVRARGVGLYWGVRGFAICTASLVGAFIWQRLGPDALLYTAFAFGCVGAVVYYALCRTRVPAAIETS